MFDNLFNSLEAYFLENLSQPQQLFLVNVIVCFYFLECLCLEKLEYEGWEERKIVMFLKATSTFVLPSIGNVTKAS